MTSTVLARKYRPLSFEAMVGQGHVVQALANALTQQRLHHAYLFTGTRGVGKTTVSRILAKSLNCVGADGAGGITASPCGRCQPCLDIDAGRFVDYIEMDAASNRGVDEISQLLDQAVYKPVTGRFKVYMIDEVHMLSNTAFNAMLKTLEEPPDYLKFVLATTDPQKVPVTVLSRCLQFNLRPMALQTVQEHLEQVLVKESVGFELGALRLLARAARGSMRDGLSLTDQAIAFGAGRLDEAVVRQMLGSVDRQHVVHLLEAVAAGDGAGLIAQVDNLRRLGLSAQGTLDDLATALQHMAVLQSVPGMAEEDADRALWLPLSRQLAPDETQLFYSLALHGRAELALAPDEYAGLLMILLRWLAFRPSDARGSSDSPKADGPARQDAGPAKAREVPKAPVVVGDTVARPEPARPGSVAESMAPPHLPPSLSPPAPAKAIEASSHHDPVQAVPAKVSAVRSPIEPDGDERPEPPPWDDEPSFSPAPEAVVEPERRPVARGAQSDGRAPSAPVPPSASASAATQAFPAASPMPPALVTTPLGDRWADVVARLQQEGLVVALVRELAIQAECVAVQDGPEQTVWRLRVERESLRTEMQRERLTQAVQKLLGAQVSLEFEAGVARDSPALRELSHKASRQAAAESLIRQDPLVNALLHQFPGARVIPGSIAAA
ncbi:MAG: DNA polymerase III subunit gamma/tau [Rubrivivax sp.]|nr:MAG: DNA polymerase III subunit gamma/tau [Rubrivivax sp.]